MIHGARLLLVEDDLAIATVVRVALEGEGAQLDHVATLAQRDQQLAAHSYDAIITDVILPDGNGLDGWTAGPGARASQVPLIVLSAQNTLDTAVQAETRGAFDYLPKPFDLDELVATLRSALARRASGRDGDLDHDEGGEPARAASRSIPATEMPAVTIIGRDPAMQQVYRTLARVAPTDLSVLILGESGTGKEMVAQAIHESSARRTAPFVAVNMAAIPRELIESELFGHEKGAFTGAHAKSQGRFAQAAAGTLFLDEIGDMPIEAQTRLLRVLQSGEYAPIGSAQLHHADVRILAATNQNLAELVQTGRFREDLYYRLNVIPIQLPALRDRRSDIPLLAQYFLKAGKFLGLPVLGISREALQLLGRLDWPGNVRELSNAMQRLALLTRAHRIEASDVHSLFPDALAQAQHATDGPSVRDPRAAVADSVAQWLASIEGTAAQGRQDVHATLIGLVERILIDQMLERHDDNQLRTAQILGINRNTLRLKRRAKAD